MPISDNDSKARRLSGSTVFLIGFALGAGAIVAILMGDEAPVARIVVGIIVAALALAAIKFLPDRRS